MQSWLKDACIYQIYPLGLVGAPFEQDNVCVPRIRELIDSSWLEHIKKLGANCLLLNPVVKSSSHGYDSIDFYEIDPRLGTKEDIKDLVAAAHANDIRVLFDAVLNHVGREFWAFQDVLQKREESPYKDWFRIDFSGNNSFDDHLSYASWEGVESLVALNHDNFCLHDYLTEVIHYWKREFDIDGLRLDVAYCLPQGYLRYLRSVANEISQATGSEFILLGECLHGDYNLWMGDDLCHTVTNYEAYKGLWSSVNSHNMHEIAYSLLRQFGSNPWCLYTGRTLCNFLDNHDVDRIATKLDDPELLPALWGLLFAMPGAPSIYYGSEWGEAAKKLPGDHELRPHFEAPKWTNLTDVIASYAHIRQHTAALRYGNYTELYVAPEQLAFMREYAGERILFAINIADSQASIANLCRAKAEDLMQQQELELECELKIEPKTCVYLKLN